MYLKNLTLIAMLCLLMSNLQAQLKVNTKLFNPGSEATIAVNRQQLEITWPAGERQFGKIKFDLSAGNPLIRQISIGTKANPVVVSEQLDPVFLLSIGKRDLLSQNGWNIFFDKVPLKPFKMYPVAISKTTAAIETHGSRTVVKIGMLSANKFTGYLEVTFYNGSPLFNIAAVMSTDADATAIVYDAGLVSKSQKINTLSWIGTDEQLNVSTINYQDSAKNLAVK